METEKYIHFFQPCHLSRPLAPLWGKIDICLRGLFCSKFDGEKLLFEASFGIMRIFGSVQPKSECIFPFLYNLIFKPYQQCCARGAICFFFLLRSKLIISVNAELYLILDLLCFYQVRILQKNKFRKFVFIISSYNSDYGH